MLEVVQNVDDVTRTHLRRFRFLVLLRARLKSIWTDFGSEIPEHIVERIIMKGRWKGSFAVRKEDFVMRQEKRANAGAAHGEFFHAALLGIMTDADWMEGKEEEERWKIENSKWSESLITVEWFAKWFQFENSDCSGTKHLSLPSINLIHRAREGEEIFVIFGSQSRQTRNGYSESLMKWKWVFQLNQEGSLDHLPFNRLNSDRDETKGGGRRGNSIWIRNDDESSSQRLRETFVGKDLSIKLSR